MTPDVRSRVLVVDDDLDIRDSLGRALGYAGYAVSTAPNGAEALHTVAQAPVDLIILDVLMPMLNGLETCRALRARGVATPVLVLTARDAIDDRVAGLEAGADDYLVKPFALRELLARVNALLRRTKPVRDRLGYADLTLDLSSRSVTRAGASVTLTKIEFALLELLVRNAERVLSYDMITDRVWGYGDAPASNALQVFVALLRRKLETDGLPRLVHNVRGVGYVLRAGA
jgi:two-component system, OmpR family, response regulator MprA